MNNQLILIKDLGYRYPTINSNYKKRYGLYKCFCGSKFEAQFQHIKRNLTTSCGCIRRKNITKLNKNKATHKLSNHRLYGVWSNMIDRCTNINNKRYKDYGEREITVCNRWLNIDNFIEDMHPSFQDGLTLDRKNVNGNYEYDNCRWTTKTVQSRNIRRIRTNNTSGYIGVSMNKTHSKWLSFITIDKKRINLGYFSTSLEAAKVRDKYIIDNNLEHTRNF